MFTKNIAISIMIVYASNNYSMHLETINRICAVGPDSLVELLQPNPNEIERSVTAEMADAKKTYGYSERKTYAQWEKLHDLARKLNTSCNIDIEVREIMAAVSSHIENS